MKVKLIYLETHLLPTPDNILSTVVEVVSPRALQKLGQVSKEAVSFLFLH